MSISTSLVMSLYRKKGTSLSVLLSCPFPCVSLTHSLRLSQETVSSHRKICCQLTKAGLWILIILSEKDEIKDICHFLWSFGDSFSQSDELNFQQLPKFHFWPLLYAHKYGNFLSFILKVFELVYDKAQNT